MYVSDRRILVMLRVGDHAPAPVVFDTGTNGNRLDLKFAKGLNLSEIGPSNAVDGSTGLPVPGFQTKMERATLGGVAIDDLEATVFEYGQEDEVGIFGPNNFPGRLVTLDFARSRIVVEPKSATTLPKGLATPYDSGGLPQLPMEIGGVKMMGSLDSGNDAPLILPLSVAPKLSLEGKLVEVGAAVSAAGSQPLYAARLKGAVRISTVKIERPRIFFMKGGDPNIGLPIMRQLRMTFDPSEGRSWVRPPIATPRTR